MTVLFTGIAMLVPVAAGALPAPQQGVLAALDGAPGDALGYSVAMTGRTAIVGAPDRNSGRGAAYLFQRSSTGWVQTAELTASDPAPGDGFGTSVSITGSTAVVGASSSNSGTGAVYLFTGSGASWSQLAKITAADGAPGDRFGGSVSISGMRLVVGAIGHGGKGAAYIFSTTNSTQYVELTASDGASGDSFGNSVSINGMTVVVGALDQSSGTGAAYVFARKAYGGWIRTAKLTAANGVAGDEFGTSVAISGATAIVGARQGNSGTGAAYAFFRTQGVWSQTAELTVADGAINDEFGSSVALSGKNAIVGARGHNSHAGAAYMFSKALSGWVQGAELSASDGAVNDEFGTSVAIGSGAIVGAPNHGSSTGAAYPFDGVSQTSKFTASDGAPLDRLGETVSISGAIALVGAKGQSSGTGAAYVFAKTTTGWVQKAKLTASDGAPGDEFGASVSISGSSAIVGAPSRDSSTGAAYVFTKTTSGWVQTAKFTASDGALGDEFGASVSISGSIAFVGANSRSSSTGAVYVFQKKLGVWGQSALLTASDGAVNDGFGTSIVMTNTYAIIGAEGRGSNAGAAYVFTRTGTVWSQTAEITATDGAAGDEFGHSVAILAGSPAVSGTAAVIGAPGHDSSTGAAYVFNQTLGVWTQTAELKATDGATSDEFGTSVGISGTTAIVGAPFHNGGTGAAYVFTQTLGGWGQTAKLTSSDGAAGDAVGSATAISGSAAIVTAPGQNSNTGAGYTFRL